MDKISEDSCGNDAFKGRIIGLESQLQENEKLLRLRTSEKNSFKARLDDAEFRNKDLAHRHDEQLKQKKIEMAKVRQLEEKLEEVSRKCSSSNDVEKEKLEQQFKEQKEVLLAKIQELEEKLEEALQGHKDPYFHLTSQIQDGEKNYAMVLQAREDENVHLKRKLEEAEKNCATLRERREFYADKFKRTTEELEALRDSISQMLDMCKYCRKHWKNLDEKTNNEERGKTFWQKFGLGGGNNDLKDNISESSFPDKRENENLKHQIEELAHRHDEQLKQKNIQMAKVRQLEEKLEEVSRKCSPSNDVEKEKLEQQFKEQEEVLLAKIQELEEKLEEKKEDKTAELERKLEEAEKNYSMVKEELHIALSEKNTLHRKLDRLTDENYFVRNDSLWQDKEEKIDELEEQIEKVNKISRAKTLENHKLTKENAELKLQLSSAMQKPNNSESDVSSFPLEAVPDVCSNSSSDNFSVFNLFNTCKEIPRLESLAFLDDLIIEALKINECPTCGQVFDRDVEETEIEDHIKEHY